jgi:hypothetical protein
LPTYTTQINITATKNENKKAPSAIGSATSSSGGGTAGGDAAEGKKTQEYKAVGNLKQMKPSINKNNAS